MAHSLIGDKIEEFQNRSGDIRAILSKKNHLLISAYELKEDHTRLAEELEAYKELSRELSPTTGVIAEIMREYLDNFLGEINKIIGFVWEYPLSVKSCGVETVGLDYKFPLVVSDLDTPIDISEGSQGQKDIINFAFTIVAMAYMGLQDYPIYMDEVGASFDHKHRGNLINYIKTLIESRQCSQLFMVNHYSSDHGGLSHTNTLVLSADNIVLPSNYNEHVKITYK
jgi:hypothetical protein